MSLVSEQFIEQILERVGPYLSEIEYIRNWLKARLGADLEQVITELEQVWQEESAAARKTDFKILMNALKKAV